MTEKGKFGLNEMDIEGLQALTAGKGVMISAVKEQVAIKAKQAELRIKQQAAEAGSSRGTTGGDVIDSSSPYAYGRDFMNSLINTPIPDGIVSDVPATTGGTSVEDAGTLLDNMVGGSEIASYEARAIKTQVIVGDSDEDARYVALDSNNNVVSDYPLPSSPIVKIDREAKKAEDKIGRKYDIQFENE